MMTESDPEQIDKELMPFMSLDARTDLRAIAMQYFLGLTGTESGCTFISSNPRYLSAIVQITNDRKQPFIAKDAYLALVNLTTLQKICMQLLELDTEPSLLYQLISYVLQPESLHADIVCSILSNLSRSDKCAQVIVTDIIKHKDTIGFDLIIQTFCRENFNAHNKLHYLGMFVANLTQVQDTRQYILDRERCVVQRLLPYTQYQGSLVRRAAVALILRNCCFQTEYHEWLLSDSVDLLPRLLLPLAGGEEYPDDEMELLPDDLQYLEPDKQRESDPDIRKILLETIFQLCALKPCRDYIKSKNTYVIMRELHKWEEDPAAMHALENLVTLLISDEPPKGSENYHDVEIPADLQARLDREHDKIMQEIQQQIDGQTGGQGNQTEGQQTQGTQGQQ